MRTSGSFPSSGLPKALVAAILVWATLCVPHLIEAAENQAQLAGTVHDSVTGAPSKGMEVVLDGVGVAARYFAVAGADGAFLFTAVEPGKYQFTLHGQNYDYVPGGRTSLLIDLEPGQKLNGIDLAAVPLGSISGTVSDPDGEPAVDAAVQVVKPQWRHGRRVWTEVRGDPLEFRHTDDRGRYRIDDLKPGDYSIFVSPPQLHGLIQPVQDEPGGPEMAAIPVYYPGVRTLAEASRVRVGAGQELGGIDVRLLWQRAFHIRGPVVAKSTAIPPLVLFHNSPYVGVRYDDGRIRDWAEFRGDFRLDGSFDVPCVPDGNYRVQARVRSASVGESAPASVQSADATGVRLRVTQFDIRIKTRMEGDARYSDPVWVSLDPADRLGATLAAWPQHPDTLQSVAPGRYVARIGFTPGMYEGAYVKRVLVGGREVTGTELDLQGPTELEIVLAKGARPVVGRANVSSQITARLTAILVPEHPLPAGWTGVYQADLDQRGAFIFWRVAPGSYRAFVVSDYDQGLWENRDFFRAVANRGTAVSVKAGAGALPIEIGLPVLSPAEVEQAAARIGN